MALVCLARGATSLAELFTLLECKPWAAVSEALGVGMNDALHNRNAMP